MAKNNGKFKMVTTDGETYAEKVSELVGMMETGEVTAVYEFNTTTSKYRPNKSAYAWLCGKRGQEIAVEEKAENEISKMFSEMRELMDELGYTHEERRNAVDSFIEHMPLKGGNE